MKTFYQITVAAAFMMSALAAHAEPISLTKIAGQNFDVYYSENSHFTPTITGNKLVLALNDFSVHSWGEGMNLSFGDTLRVVAHDGMTVKTSFTQTFNGAFQFPWNATGNERFRTNLYTSLYKTEGSLTSEVAYAVTGITLDPSNSWGDELDGNSLDKYWGALYDKYTAVREDSAYKELDLSLGAEILAYGPDPYAPVSGWLDSITYSFEIQETAADVPEPAGLALFALGGVALAYRRRNRKHSN